MNSKPHSKSRWAKVGKAWVDRYHPNVYKPADGSRHSKKTHK